MECDQRGIPIIPQVPEDVNPLRPVDPNPIVAVCGECGLDLRQVMGYCCGNARCPTGLGGPSARYEASLVGPDQNSVSSAPNSVSSAPNPTNLIS